MADSENILGLILTPNQEGWCQIDKVSLTPGDYFQFEFSESADGLTKYYLEYAGDVHRWRLRRVTVAGGDENITSITPAGGTGYTAVTITAGDAVWPKRTIVSGNAVISCQARVSGTWTPLFGGDTTDNQTNKITAAGRLGIGSGASTDSWEFSSFGGGSLSAPTNTAAPTITGSTAIGSTLTVAGDTWNCGDITRSYQWTRAGTNIVGATSSTYVTTLGDFGTAIGCVVTAATPGGSTPVTASNTITVTGAFIGTVAATSTVSGAVVARRAVRGTINANATVDAILTLAEGELIETVAPGPFATAVYEQMQPVAQQDADHSGALLKYIVGLSQMFEDVDLLARSGWSIMLDIDRIPEDGLPWFGQFMGVNVDTSLSVNDQKQQIRDHRGWARGRPKTLKASIGRYLTDSKTVVIIERDTSPYHFEVITYDSETPAGLTYDDLYNNYLTYDEFLSENSSYETYLREFDGRYDIELTITDQKPGGLQFTYTVLPGSPGSYMSYEDLYIDYDTYQEVFDALQTYDDLYITP